MKYLLALALSIILIAGMVAFHAVVTANPPAPSSGAALSGSQLLLLSLAQTIEQYPIVLAVGIVFICLSVVALCPFPARARTPKSSAPPAAGSPRKDAI